jgi:hypothetical protein
MYDEIFVMIMPIYVFVFSVFVLFRGWQYFGRRDETGRVLFKIAPYGRRRVEIALYLVMFAALIPLAWYMTARSGFEPVGHLYFNQMLFADSLLMASIVFLCFPVKICENGMVFPSGFVPWDAVKSFERKTDHLVVFRLNRIFELTSKAKLVHSPECREELDAVLRERVA